MVVLLRLQGVSQRVFARLLEATWPEDRTASLTPFVDIKGSDFSKSNDGFAEVDLKITGGGTDKACEKVPRHIVDQMWNILGIFPRTSFEGDLAKEIDFIRGVAGTIAKTTKEPANAENAHGIQSVCERLLSKAHPVEHILLEEEAKRAKIAVRVARIRTRVAEARVRHDSPDLENIYELLEDLDRNLKS